MKKTALSIFLIFFFISSARGIDERKLRREISLLNLLNGLYLTEEQLVQLVDLSRRADMLRGEFGRSGDTEKTERLESFQRLREELVYGADVPGDIRSDATQMNRAARELKDQYKIKMYRLANGAEAVFTEGQKQVITDFKPCLNPPKDLRNPERAGQVESSDHIERILSRLRDAPPHRQERMRERVVDRHIERFALRGGPHTGEAIAAERERISELIDRAIDTSEVDFEMMVKSEIAKDFKPDAGPPKKPIGRKIANFFLCPLSTAVLEDKLSGTRSSKK